MGINKLNFKYEIRPLALIATVSAIANPGRDRIVGETCVKTEDRCVDKDKKEGENLKCCNIMITVFTTNKQTVCVNTTEKQVTIADGTGMKYGFNCAYVETGAIAKGVSATVAALSALYLAA